MGSKFKGTKQELRALNSYISLSRAYLTVDYEVNAHLRKHNLTKAQFAVLEALYHLGSLNQRDLAGKILCTPGNLTGIIRNLLGLGLIQRTPRSDDKRYLEVSVSDKGRKLVERVMPEHVRRIVRNFKYLSSNEQDELHYLLKKLGKKLRA